MRETSLIRVHQCASVVELWFRLRRAVKPRFLLLLVVLVDAAAANSMTRSAFAAQTPASPSLQAIQSKGAPRNLFQLAETNALDFQASALASRRVLQAWLRHADERTLLLPDRVPGGPRGAKSGEKLYTPHNSGADLYPYLILTAHLTDPDLFRGRMIEMLRNDLRYTTTRGLLPGNLDLTSGKLGDASFFGAAEYAKDGLIAVTEMLGRTPWFERMDGMMRDFVQNAPLQTRFGKLPGNDAEINGDVLQTLARLIPMTGDPLFLQWARQICDAYIEEIIPGNHGVPSSRWNFETRKGDGQLRLRDHGNEAVVGLTLLYALERRLDPERAARMEKVLGPMFDRILASANPDGMLFNTIDAATLKPVDSGLSDNWGYVYGAIYTFYQCTGQPQYREAVLRVLRNLPKYRNHNWEGSSFDGYADSLESALYLVNREPVPEALDWIESEVRVMRAMQKADGHLEYWYGEGNFNRTLLLYLYMKSQGCRPDPWTPEVSLGAAETNGKLFLAIRAEKEWSGKVVFDQARHRVFLNLPVNYVRLNEFPEWFVADSNKLYRIRSEKGEERMVSGAELIQGISLQPGRWIVEVH